MSENTEKRISPLLPFHLPKRAAPLLLFYRKPPPFSAISKKNKAKRGFILVYFIPRLKAIRAFYLNA